MTLYNLSTHRVNRPLLLDTVSTLVIILDTYTHHASIQRHTILTLGHIAKRNIDHKLLICEEGGMMAIMKAVEVFGEQREGFDVGVEDAEGVLRAAYWSLRRLGMPRLNGLDVGSEVEESDGENV